MQKLLFLLLLIFPAVAYSMERQPLLISTPTGADHRFMVEVARTPEEMMAGLMFRTQLLPNAGMLFLKPAPGPMSLWMKNTLVSLDIIFIRPDLTVLSVHSNARPGDLNPVSSGEEVLGAIEIPGGRAEELGIVPGSRVSARAFP
jgi:uncharacterized membrane protein (UPF0127 family)